MPSIVATALTLLAALVAIWTGLFAIPDWWRKTWPYRLRVLLPGGVLYGSSREVPIGVSTLVVEVGLRRRMVCEEFDIRFLASQDAIRIVEVKTGPFRTLEPQYGLLQILRDPATGGIRAGFNPHQLVRLAGEAIYLTLDIEARRRGRYRLSFRSASGHGGRALARLPVWVIESQEREKETERKKPGR